MSARTAIPHAWKLAVLVGVMLILAGCQTIMLPRPIRARSGDWTTTGGSPARNTVSDMTVAPPLVKVWSYNATGGFGASGPLVLGDAILVGNRKGEVHAIRLERGKRLGVVNFKEPVEGGPVLDGPRMIVATGWGPRTLYSYDLTRGTRIWATGGGPFEATPLLLDKILVTATVGGAIEGRTVGDGAVQWTAEGRGRGHSAALISPEGIWIVAADQTGLVRSIRAADGDIRWSRDLQVPVYEAPVAAGDVVIVPTTRGRITALETRTGIERWTHEATTTTARFAPAAVAGDQVYVASTDGRVSRLDIASGHALWTAQLDHGVIAQPLVTGDIVWLGTLGSRLVALDSETGDTLWSTELPGRVKSSLTAYRGGIIVLAEPRDVLYFRMEGVDDEE